MRSGLTFNQTYTLYNLIYTLLSCVIRAILRAVSNTVIIITGRSDFIIYHTIHIYIPTLINELMYIRTLYFVFVCEKILLYQIAV